MDCYMMFLILGLVFGWWGYRLLDKYFPWIFMGGMVIMRVIFILLMVGALMLGGFTGEEILIGAAWAAFELMGAKIKPRNGFDTSEEDD